MSYRPTTWARRLLGGLAAVMGISSYLAYTTVGFDFEAASGAGVEVAYYRLRWDDGSTWAGWAVQPVRRPDRGLDWFDPGGTLFDRPTRPDHPRWWNRWGFWWIIWASDDPYVALRYPDAGASFWVAVPSWLVIAGFWSPELVRVGRRLAARWLEGRGWS